MISPPQNDISTLPSDSQQVHADAFKTDIEAIGTVNSDPELEARRRRLEQLKIGYGITWNGIDDPDDPYNWATWRKVTIGIVFSIGQLVTLMTASMITAALDDISHDLDIDAATAQIVFSTYFLGLAFGPFVVAALAEMHGRKWIWVAGNAWYIFWNGISPVRNSKALMILGRLMTGFGASAGVTVSVYFFKYSQVTFYKTNQQQLTGPTMADVFGKRDRGKGVAIASFLPYLGPALGPIVGGIVTQLVKWQWIFWIMCAFNAGTTILGIFCIRESYTPVLLRRKARGHAASPTEALEAAFWKDFLSRFGSHLLRPIRLLLKRPVVQIIGFILAVDFAIYTLVLGTYATLFIERYGDSASISSLHYIAIAIGATGAAQIGGRFMDWSYRRLSSHYGKDGQPEFRVPYLVPGVILTPIGLFLYGWAAEYIIAWPVVDVGAALFTLGSFVASQMLYAYQLDEFVEHGASANAATRVLSYSLGFAFPIFGPGLHQHLGYGWGTSLLAFLWTVLCFPLPIVFWYLGPKIRAMGKEANEGLIDGA